LTWWELSILVIGGVAGGIVFSSINLFWFVLWLRNRESYSPFLGLSARHRLAFLGLVLRNEDKQIPLYVKLIPLALGMYLSIPFNIIPDFVPVLGDLDDLAMLLLALVLVSKLMLHPMVLELLQQAQRNIASLTAGEGL
jgi:uncharacterized membrane protein YkvA (DUF1232 family)